MPPSGKIEIFRRAAAAARAAREIFRGSLFCLNFMYFLRFEHGFHVQAKLYAPRMLSGVFRAFCGSSDRAPHHATTVSKYAHARAQLAEYAWIPPLTTPIRPHATMHALLHGRLQQSIEHAHKARRRESPRLALPCRERLSCSGGRGWDSRRRGHSRGGHCARDLIMTLMIRSPGGASRAAAVAEEQLRDGRCCGGRGQPGPARTAQVGDSKDAPSSHRQGDGSDGADSVRPASSLRRVRSTKKSRRSRALAKFGRCRREGASLSLGDRSCEAGEGGLPH